jgi:type III secretory pathway component EscV
MEMKNIKSDRTLLMTSILLFFMLAAGIFSGVMSFIMGHAALKGVTQPDIRPNNTNRADRYNANTKGLELIDEQDLIADVKKQIGQYDPKIDSAEARQQAAKAKKQATAFEKAVKNDPKVDLPGVRVPIAVEDQGIVMKVQSIKSDKNNFNFGLALVNQGSQSVNFGNNKIEVVNDKSQGISANTIGLPSSLPANGKEIKFNLTIPKNALDKVKKISLQLTDVDNKLQLEAAGIAVNKK